MPVEKSQVGQGKTDVVVLSLLLRLYQGIQSNKGD